MFTSKQWCFARKSRKNDWRGTALDKSPITVVFGDFKSFLTWIALLRRAPIERTLVFHISLLTAKITQDKLQQFYQNDKKIISVNFKTGILRLILFYYLIRLNKRRHFQNRTIKLHMLVFNK